MDLSVFLVELLRLHDCVIIPDLGGFIANYRPAEIDMAGNKFFPPKKEIIFSSKLNRNDGLLVNHISDSEGLGYLEARKMVSEFTDEAWSKLENDETLEFPKIGSLRFDKNEKLIFEPAIHENLLLDAYGMEAFHFPELTRHDTIPVKTVFRDKESVRPVFSSRKVKRLLIAIPILIAIALIPVARLTLKDGNLMKPQTSATTSLPLTEAPKSIIPEVSQPAVSEANIETKTETNSNVKESTETVSDKTSTDEVKAPLPATTTDQAKGKYRVIGGCFRNRDNADKLFALMVSKGYQPEIKPLKSGAFMVTIQSYSDRNEALQTLDSLQKAEPEAGYWMMKDK
jgi:hypothetical protein